MTLYDIYKMYKHSEDLSNVEITKLFRALKKNHLQVFLVKNINNELELYNFVPETSTFYRVV